LLPRVISRSTISSTKTQKASDLIWFDPIRSWPPSVNWSHVRMFRAHCPVRHLAENKSKKHQKNSKSKRETEYGDHKIATMRVKDSFPTYLPRNMPNYLTK
jgi:hypothetical protein